MGKKYSPRRVRLSRGSFIIELREDSSAHNTNLSIIAAFQTKSSFPTSSKKKKKRKANWITKFQNGWKEGSRVSEATRKKQDRFTPKPALRKDCKDSRQEIKKKRECATVQNDAFRQLYPQDFSLYAHLCGTASHRVLSVSLSLFLCGNAKLEK